MLLRLYVYESLEEERHEECPTFPRIVPFFPTHRPNISSYFINLFFSSRVTAVLEFSMGTLLVTENFPFELAAPYFRLPLTRLLCLSSPFCFPAEFPPTPRTAARLRRVRPTSGATRNCTPSKTRPSPFCLVAPRPSSTYRRIISWIGPKLWPWTWNGTREEHVPP